jgi:predicted O-methyltransferase YrrM
VTSCPDLRQAFPHTEEFIVNGLPTRHDVDFHPSCGYVSQDEARLLWLIARAFRGVWCEIGSHTGWSGAHIAAARVALVAIEPKFVYLSFFRRARHNWRRAGVDHRIYPVAARSGDYFKDCRETFAGVFVDGDHEPDHPLEDARDLLPHLADRGVVVFHDFNVKPIRGAVTWLVRHHGFRFHVYNTVGMLTVCWRGDDDWRPPSHIDDASIDWQALRAQHTDFDYREES